MNERDITAAKAEWCDVMRLLQRAQARLNELSAYIEQHERPAPPAPAADPPVDEPRGD